VSEIGRSVVLRSFHGVPVREVVDSYWVFLARNHYDAHLKRFRERLEADAKAAEAEAVVFSLLWSSKARPDVLEDASAGGADFICRPAKMREFVVEVKSLRLDCVARRSHWPLKSDGRVGGAFGLDTPKLKNVALKANRQLGRYALPRVLAIVLSNDSALVLMDCHAVESLLVSDPVPSTRLDTPGMLAVDLRNSVFIKPDKAGGIVPCLPHISAVWLVGIFGDQSRLVGALHPEPEIPFDPNLFPCIPYGRLRRWPVPDGRLGVEWTPGKREPAGFPHSRVQ
jgi:hypothetical protein